MSRSARVTRESHDRYRFEYFNPRIADNEVHYYARPRGETELRFFKRVLKEFFAQIDDGRHTPLAIGRSTFVSEEIIEKGPSTGLDKSGTGPLFKDAD